MCARKGEPWDQGKGGAFAGQPPTQGEDASGKSRKAASKLSALGHHIRTWYETCPYSREAVVAGAVGVAFSVIGMRLIYLQAFATGDISARASWERTARLTLHHRRGAIYDRNGNVLARSVDAVDIAVHPNRVSEINATANLIASVLGGDAADYARTLQLDTNYAYLAKKADPEMAELLKTRLAEVNETRADQGLTELGGFEFENTSRRVYTQGEIAGNVVGTVNIDGVGATGLELFYNDVLTGTDGYLVEERGLYGTPVVGGEYLREEPVDGENIVVSIDLDIQRVAQEQLTQTIADWKAGDGIVIVMQPETGEILACASTPFLNLTDISKADVAAFNVRSVSDSYEPGSTFKPITVAAAIDLGIAKPDTKYDCPDQIQVGDDMVGDSDERDYGLEMTLTNVLERSSNVGIVLCAEGLGAQNFNTYAQRFRIGSKTGIDYPGEVAGIVPSLDEYTGAWAAMAFGQAIAVPPIQMARAIGALANEGVLTHPHFLINKGGNLVRYPMEGQAVKAETAHQVTQMMHSVMENGYGQTGRVEGYNLAGKTGTAERVDFTTGQYLDHINTVSFIGYGPIEDPKVLVYVLVDYVAGGQGSSVTGPPWAVIMEEALKKLQIPPSY